MKPISEPQERHSPRRIDARNSFQVLPGAIVKTEAIGRVGVGVGAAHEGEVPPLLLRHDHEVLDEGVVLVGHRAVLHLEDVEEREHRLEEDLGRLAHPVRLEEVVGGEEEVLGPEVLDEVEDVPALPVDDGVLLPGRGRRR